MHLQWSPDYFFDCGSERTVFAVGSQIVFDEPTCVAYYPDTESVVAVGQEAVALQHSGQRALQVSWPVRTGRIAEPVAAKLFLQTLIRRAEPQAGHLAKLFGARGRYSHPTLASPAQLHVFQQVFSQLGLSNLKPTPLAVAAGAVIVEQKLPTELCVCNFSADWTECSALVGSQPVVTLAIPWGTAALRSMVQRVVQSSHGASISSQAADMVVATIIDCSTSVSEAHQKERKNTKMSVKAKKPTEVTSTTIVVAQNSFSDEVIECLRPLVDGFEEFFDRLAPEMATAISEHGVRLHGDGQQIQGLLNFVAQVFDAEVVWAEQPHQQAVRGMQALARVRA